MFKLSETGGKATTYLRQRLGLTQLAEEHGNKLVPAGKTLAVLFSLGVTNSLQEIAFVKDL
jgi:hypothetical protein